MTLTLEEIETELSKGMPEGLAVEIRRDATADAYEVRVRSTWELTNTVSGQELDSTRGDAAAFVAIFEHKTALGVDALKAKILNALT